MQPYRARADGAGRPAGHELLLAPTTPGHSVQFYEDESFLVSTVADFVAAGLTVGEPVIIVATKSHREAFSSRLRLEGFDVDAVTRTGQLAWMDADDALSQIVVESTPDPSRFDALIGRKVERTLAGRQDTIMRLYGEMVDVLWTRGNTEGAIQLEELWNGLAARHDFSLLCAYAMGHFYKASDAEHFRAVCSQHTHVLGPERHRRPDERPELRELSQLRRRAQTLEAEIEQRKELERRLREALAARRTAEEALLASQHDLEAVLAERERLLASEHGARKDAEAANRAKSEFLAVMSHELRTPLNAIAGHVQLVEMGIHGPITDAQRDALCRVRSSQRQLLALINDVLNLVRIESGRVEYAMGEIPLEPLVEEVTSMLEPLVTGGALTCRTMLGGPGAQLVVRADRGKVEQILVNLLTNAIKFTAPGGEITIESAVCTADARMASVQVRDTGVGIDPAKLGEIFEPFVQLAARPRGRYDGVGLGLAISRDLARGMGGDLTAVSRLGLGATFTLSLPRV